MSFILDALKKSEIERQRQSVPGLIDTRSGPRRNRLPVWAVILGVLLGINLLVLTFVLTRKNTPGAHVSSPAKAARVSDGDAALPTPRPFSPLDAAPVYAPEIPVAPVNSAAPVLSAPARAPSAGGAVVHHAHRSDPLLTDQESNLETQEVLPTISEISLSGSQALPELHLDVHVYATSPPERFVYVNMRKYHEGSTLQEGPTVERIRRDGVVLNYQGLRFILPRQP
ncbi:MAG TPA: general secretion pathway protein GspB [Steroidobacteraceae bacterium]|jgi:general secretion pathway protein B|nr:general secretion pathway protein GspB [Steroidobacteraceae bacterium]